MPRRAARPYTTYSLTPPQTEGPTRTIPPPAARDTDEGSVDRDALRRPRVGVGEGPTSCRSIHSAGGRSLCVTPEGGSTCLGTTEPSPSALGPAPENGTGVTCTPVCRLCLKCSSDLHDAGAAIAGLRAHGPTRTRVTEAQAAAARRPPALRRRQDPRPWAAALRVLRGGQRHLGSSVRQPYASASSILPRGAQNVRGTKRCLS